MKNNLKVIRANKGLTQEQLATMAGISRPTLAQIETEATTPDGDTIAKLVKALNCSAGYIFDDLSLPCYVSPNDTKMGVFHLNRFKLITILESLLCELRQKLHDDYFDDNPYSDISEYLNMIAFFGKALKEIADDNKTVSCGLTEDYQTKFANLKKSYGDKE